ncbi:MAG: hypothetical protein H0X13_15190 [Ramlibacter sp.]|nr:hypothetical protein [Ramlibacter sp.]
MRSSSNMAVKLKPPSLPQPSPILQRRSMARQSNRSPWADVPADWLQELALR